MPYFHSGTLRSVHNRERLHKKNTTSRICLDGKQATHGLHLPLTLDEYCNSSLDQATLDQQNRDQVLVRYAMRQRGLSQIGNSHKCRGISPKTRLLMVHQVWIYGFGTNFIVAFPEAVLKEHSILKALTDHWTPWKKKANDYLLNVARWLTAFAGLLETRAGLDRPALDIYEETISVLSKDVEAHFKKSIKEREKAAYYEKQYLHTIVEVREELSMIRSVVARQDRVWADLKTEILANWSDSTRQREDEELKQAAESSHKCPNKKEMTTIEEISLRLQRLNDRIDRADRNAERVQNLIPQYLELKRSHTAMKESHYTALLGAAIFGFSIVTIIFVPMMFILALLAIPSDNLLVDSVKAGHKRFFIGKWTGITEGTSLGLTLVAMVLDWWAFKKPSGLRDSKEKDTKSNASNTGSAGGNRASAGSEVQVSGGILRSTFRSMLRGTRKRADVEQGHGVRKPHSETRD